MKEYFNFENWRDEDRVSKQNTSKLYSLKPIGIGSSMVESLSGYITRLAVEHRTTTGKVISDVITPFLDKYYLNEISKRGGNGFYDSAHMINGVSIAAKQFSTMLDELTGNSNLHFLTLLRFSEVIPQRGLFRTKRAWCPACYEDMLHSKVSVYEPLLWQIKVVSVCRKHRTLLTETCPNCGKTNLVLDRRSIPGICSHCHIWLGKGKVLKPDIFDFESYTKTKMAERLLEGDDIFHKDGIIKSLGKIVAEENSNVAHLARKLSLPKTTFWGWVKGKNTPPLLEVIRICNKYGIDIVDFYKGNLQFGPGSPVIFSKRIKKQNLKITKRPLFEIRKLVKGIVNDSSTGNLHVQAMADVVGCNKKTMYNHLPSQCKSQAVKRMQFLMNQKNNRLMAIKQKVTSAAVKYYDKNGSMPGMNRLEDYLNQPALFKEQEIKNFYCSSFYINTIARPYLESYTIDS